MLQTLIKIIRINGGPSTRQFVNATLERLNYLSEHLSIFVKSIQMIHKTFQLISRIIKKRIGKQLYMKVVRICCKSMFNKKDTERKPKIKYLFQGNYARWKNWFDPDIEWVGENFSTRKCHFYKRLFHINIERRYGLTYPIFPVPIGNAKEAGEIEYGLQAPLVAYN